jgi:hypothetical protein
MNLLSAKGLRSVSVYLGFTRYNTSPGVALKEDESFEKEVGRFMKELLKYEYLRRAKTPRSYEEPRYGCKTV